MKRLTTLSTILFLGLLSGAAFSYPGGAFQVVPAAQASGSSLQHRDLQLHDIVGANGTGRAQDADGLVLYYFVVADGGKILNILSISQGTVITGVATRL
jgi:hypothetical protein